MKSLNFQFKIDSVDQLEFVVKVENEMLGIDTSSFIQTEKYVISIAHLFLPNKFDYILVQDIMDNISPTSLTKLMRL